MTRPDHIRVIDGEHTEPGACQRCARLERKLATAEAERDAAERDLRTKRATITALKRDRDKARQDYVNREQVEQLMQLWRDQCGHPRSKLDGERFDRLKWGLETYGFELCALVIYAAGQEPYRNRKGEVVDRISFLFRDAELFEQWANKGARLKRAERA